MSCEDEVLTIRKKLEKMTSEDTDQSQALDLLNCLGKLDINLQILTSTRWVEVESRACSVSAEICNFYNSNTHIVTSSTIALFLLF